MRTRRGLVRCERCYSMFDALKFISESSEAEMAEIQAIRLPWETVRGFSNSYWKVGFFAGLSLLIVQLICFGKDAIIQNPSFRDRLEMICKKSYCTLPVYKNPKEIAVLHSAFDILPDHNFMLQVVFSNHASFEQAFPSIVLTLLDRDKKPFAERRFHSTEYLPETNNKLMASQLITTVNLKVVAPETGVGSYTIILTD